jgi:uncharacterized RDD family membrane protein YckC
LCYTRGLVQCPKCRKSELDESGSCPVCDTRIQTVTPVEGLARSKRPRIPADNLEEHGPERINDRAQKGEPLPQWRLDLNRRLQKIKQDREALEKTAKLGQLPFPKPELQGRSAPLVQRSRIARKMPRQPARQAGEPPQAESANQLPYPVDASSSEPEPVTRAEASRVGSPGAEESISHYPVDPAPLAAPLSGDSKPEAAAEPSGTGSPGIEESLSHYPVDPAPLAASLSGDSKPEPVAEAEASRVGSPGAEESLSHYPVDPAPLAAPLSGDSKPEPAADAEASGTGSPGTEESISHYPVDPAPLAASLSGDSKPEPAADAEASGTGSPGTEESLSHYPVDPAPLAASFSDGSKPEPVAEAEASVASREAGESIPLSNPVEIENLIDSVMAREAIQTQASELPEKIIAPEEVRDEGSPEKLILLSRTLSGLVDLIIVFLCGSAFILVTDTVSGITVFDSLSLLHYSFLLVAIFLVYSLFFLGTANQTIGMMITNLRVVGKSGSRPTFVRLLIRSAVYLLSLLALGAGLIWGFFDADSDCLQDKLSQTHVVRLA